MDLLQYAEHAQLRRFVRQIDEGKYLFRQGQMGSSLFIILEGRVRLVALRKESEHLVNLLGAGQFLGEKALLRQEPYRRLYSAYALLPTKVLELTLNDIEKLQQAAPNVMVYVLKRVFQQVAERLDRSMSLAKMLRPSDPFEKLVSVILYFCQTFGKKVSHGYKVPVSVESIFYHMDMDKTLLEKSLELMVERKILKPLEKELYLVSDEESLKGVVSLLQEKLSPSSA